jgi:hypothetical protein
MPPKKEEPENNNIIDELSKFDSSEELPSPDQAGIPTPKETQEAPPQQQPIPENNPLLDEAPIPESEPASNPFNNQQPAQFQQSSTEEFQQIAESIVEEKFAEFQSRFGDLPSWKEHTGNDISSLKQEMLRTQDRFTELQKALFGKVNEYNDSISNVSTEMKALEKVFEKILEPLTSNIKELKKITEDLKKK